MWDFALIAGLLGGVGLLLLGMGAMTEGLRAAAGEALGGFLARATGSPLRGVATGALLTGVVQSSSATTVATLGFVNAGLLTLYQAVPVIYGANIGTTVTSWLVALVGLQFQIKIYALPMIGIGMLLRIFAGTRRIGSVGYALVGFGVFFTGIEMLRETFADLGTQLPVAELLRAGPAGVFMALGLGFVLTMLMQSSSAAMTIILTLAAGGLVALPGAAVMIIGANLGTTSTALLATLGATANARRAALAHVAFNAGTGVVALALLPLLIALLTQFASRTEAGGGAVAVLALFHTAFNVLGVLLFLPLTRRLVAFLEQRFRTQEEDAARPLYLDATLLQTPALAQSALQQELARLALYSRRLALAALGGLATPAQFSTSRESARQLLDRIADYAQQLQTAALDPQTAASVVGALRVMRDIDLTLQRTQALLTTEAPADETLKSVESMAHGLLSVPESVTAVALVAFAEAQEQARAVLLQVQPGADLRAVMHRLDRIDAIRRVVEEALKAHRHLQLMAADGTPSVSG